MNKKKNGRSIKFYILWVAFAVVISALITVVILEVLESNKRDNIVSYNVFMEYVESGSVDTVWYNNTDEYMDFVLFTEETSGLSLSERNEYTYDSDSKLHVLYPGGTEFRETLLKHDVNLRLKHATSTGVLIATSVTPVIFDIILLIIMLSLIGSIIGQGGNKAEVLVEQDTGVSFDDIIGQDEVLEDIKFFSKMLKEPEVLKYKGIRVPKGLLFSGEPGTGKTMIAKAIAKEAGVPFIYMNASSFIELYVGVGAKRVRNLFKEARENAPCIVFIDEIDAVGKSRDSKRATSSEDTQTINALLQEMDGFEETTGILVIAATNSPDVLDKALTRAGRFDREIVIAPPKDWTVRLDLFKRYLKGVSLEEGVDLNRIARETSGFTGADIAAICNEAGIIGYKKAMECNSYEWHVTEADIEEAIDKRVLKGNKRKCKETDDIRRRVACHEAGHALISYLRGKPIARATTVGATSGVGGFVIHADEEAGTFVTKEALETNILIAYGGRAAEALIYGNNNISVGAGADIQQATKMLQAYVGVYGFDTDSGLIDIQGLQQQGLVSEEYVFDRIKQLSTKFYNVCWELLIENSGLHEQLMFKLYEKETLTGDEIVSLLDNVKGV